MSESMKDKMQAELSVKINDALDMVIQQKNDYYQKNPLKIPEISSINSLINSTALTNATISGGASLIPGPWGMAAVIPEIALVIRNQISLIYDIAAAHQKKDILTKEMLASILLYSMGNAGGSLVIVTGGKFLVKRASLRVLQKIIGLLGGKVTQQLLKSTISKWLPGVGAAAMAVWSNYTTRQIGKKANEILGSTIIFEDRLQDIELIAPINQSASDNKESLVNLNFYKMQIIIALSKIDGTVDKKEAVLIGEMIEKSEIDTDSKVKLITMLGETMQPKIQGLSDIKNSPMDALSLLTDLVAVAKVDGKIHITEKLFIKQIGKEIGFSDGEIDDLLVS